MLSSYRLSSRRLQQILKMSSIWISSRMDTSRHGLSHPFKRPERLTMVWQASKLLWCSVPTFWIGAEYTRNVGVFSDKNLQDWTTVGAVLRTLFCRHILIWTLFPCFVVGKLTPGFRPSIICTPCVEWFNYCLQI